jgi:hypothetical protein
MPFKDRHLRICFRGREDPRGGGGADVGRGGVWGAASGSVGLLTSIVGGHKGPCQPYTTPAPTATTSL